MTKIEWCNGDDGIEGKTWNPVTGCTKVSAGCKNCYAEGVAERFWAKQYPPVGNRPRRFTDVQCHPDRLDAPLRWRKPRRVFVNSMSDLFHDDVPDEFIDKVFAVMALAPQHSFQVLTKRPERMRRYLQGDDIHGGWTRNDRWSNAGAKIDAGRAFECGCAPQVLPNVWLGVSAEDQATADERIPILLDTPAAVRFLSCEPLLGRLDLTFIRDGDEPFNAFRPRGMKEPCDTLGLDWVIVGGESGHGARPCDVDWIRSIVEQCKAAGVSCFVKQLGAFSTHTSEVVQFTGEPQRHTQNRNLHKNGKGGDPAEWPVDLCMRQWPESAK